MKNIHIRHCLSRTFKPLWNISHRALLLNSFLNSKDLDLLRINIRTAENSRLSGQDLSLQLSHLAGYDFIGSGSNSDPALTSTYGWREINNTQPYSNPR